MRIADWMYQEITTGSQPDVLTVHPDYFLIATGVGRFIYRLARKAAGKDMAAWGFATLFTRSGSKGAQKEFNRLLREVVAANNLPEYSLAEEPGQGGSASHGASFGGRQVQEWRHYRGLIALNYPIAAAQIAAV